MAGARCRRCALELRPERAIVPYLSVRSDGLHNEGDRIRKEFDPNRATGGHGVQTQHRQWRFLSVPPILDRASPLHYHLQPVSTIPNNVVWMPLVTGSQEGGRSVFGVACDGFVNGEWLGWQSLAATHGGGGRSGTDCSFRCSRGEEVELAAGTGRGGRRDSGFCRP
ncbi:hypothetical protein SESBI_07603 [Sesbania bispinosa]|nr:hypothetical protein SESBI_07603 [Sesbania bispinosa]